MSSFDARCTKTCLFVIFRARARFLWTETEFFGLGDKIGSAGYLVSFVRGTLFRSRIASRSCRQSLLKKHARYGQYYHAKFFEFQSPEQAICREENGTFCISGGCRMPLP